MFSGFFNNPQIFFSQSFKLKCNVNTRLFRFRSDVSNSSSFMFRFKPVTPTLRHTVKLINVNSWRGQPFKGLVFGSSRNSGRNMCGHLTVRHCGAYLQRLKLRRIDRSCRNMRYIPFYVCSLEKTSNSHGYLSLVYYINGSFSYILSSVSMEANKFFFSNKGGLSPFDGGSFLLYVLSVGSVVFNVELRPFCGGILCRSPGMFATLIQKLHSTSWLRLPTGSVRVISSYCMATLGVASRELFRYIVYGSAGRLRRSGVRPTVRGVAMNPVDHPHGGGEGRTSGGRPSVTPWSVFTKGVRTRNPRIRNSFLISK